MNGDYCPINSEEKRCAIVSDDLINQLGDRFSKPIDRNDLINVAEISRTAMYNEVKTMRGLKRTLALDIGGNGSWVRLDVSKIDDPTLNTVLNSFGCI